MNRKILVLDLDEIYVKYGKIGNYLIPKSDENILNIIKTMAEFNNIIILNTKSYLLDKKWLIKNKIEKYVIDIINITKISDSTLIDEYEIHKNKIKLPIFSIEDKSYTQ